MLKYSLKALGVKERNLGLRKRKEKGFGQDTSKNVVGSEVLEMMI